MKKTYEIDMCNGPLFGKILLFSLPLMLSGILQLLFNAADVVVVGQFAGDDALAAVGSNASLINLFVNLFIGCSIGTNVLVAQYYGAKDRRNVEGIVHTSILLGFICGVFLIFLGVFLAPEILKLMDTPENVLPLSTLYIRIYFLGMPAMLVYNFGAAILRAVGDTRRPLYYLLVSGILNVVLNLVFVIQFNMSVAGVALATVISQYLSAVLICHCLMTADGIYQLRLQDLRMEKHKVLQIVRIGLPAGLQSVVFSISNVMIQSSINSFGSIAMAGNTAASSLDGFIYTAMNAVYQTTLSFTSQNMGGRKWDRIPKILGQCLIVVTVIGIILGNLGYQLGPMLLQIYSSDEEVIAYGMIRMSWVGKYYFLCGIMEVFVGVMRGLGYAVLPMLVSLTGACLLRVVWIMTIFQQKHTLDVLYLSYPVTWIITLAVHFICVCVVWRKIRKTEM